MEIDNFLEEETTSKMACDYIEEKPHAIINFSEEEIETLLKVQKIVKKYLIIKTLEITNSSISYTKFNGLIHIVKNKRTFPFPPLRKAKRIKSNVEERNEGVTTVTNLNIDTVMDNTEKSTEEDTVEEATVTNLNIDTVRDNTEKGTEEDTVDEATVINLNIDTVRDNTKKGTEEVTVEEATVTNLNIDTVRDNTEKGTEEDTTVVNMNTEEHSEEDTTVVNMNTEEHTEEDTVEKTTDTYLNLDTMNMNFFEEITVEKTNVTNDTVNITNMNFDVEEFINMNDANMETIVSNLGNMNFNYISTSLTTTTDIDIMTNNDRSDLPTKILTEEDNLTNFKEEILNLVNKDFFYLPETDYHENNFKNILYNCSNSELRLDAQNCILLFNYFRVGNYLDYIKKSIFTSIGYRDEKNVITGIIKGSGLAHLYVKDGKFGINERKNARVFYNKAMRVFRIYSCFPCPVKQICRSTKINANRFIRVGKNDRFDLFVQQIKDEIRKDYYKYNDDDFEYQINYDLITVDIINSVTYYIQNISAPLNL